jgi:hypothetical protein
MSPPVEKVAGELVNKKRDWLDIASLVAPISLAVPYLAKKFAPAVFGGFYFQTTCAALGALILCVTMLGCLHRMFSRGETSRTTLVNFFLSAALFVAMLSTYVISQPMTSALRSKLWELERNYSTSAVSLLARLEAVEPGEPSRQVAMGIYSVSGIRVLYETSEGFALYEPSGEDNERLTTSKNLAREYKNTQLLLENLQKNFNILAMIYVGALGVVFFIGTPVLLILPRHSARLSKQAQVVEGVG